MGHKSGVQFRVLRSRLHPLPQAPATSRQGQQIFKVELQFEFGDAIFLFELVYYIDFTVSRSGELLPRTPARTFPVATPFACAAHPALPPPAGCESHDSSPLVCAGSKLNTHPLHPQRSAASRAAAGMPRAPMRLVGPSPSHAAHDCLRAAGPRATPWTSSDEPGRL